jgi:hypothetical protein
MNCVVWLMKDERCQGRPVPIDNPLNELARNNPSDAMSRYSTSAKNFGSTQVAFGFLIALVSFDLGLTTVSSCFLIWLETVRDIYLSVGPIQRADRGDGYHNNLAKEARAGEHNNRAKTYR